MKLSELQKQFEIVQKIYDNGVKDFKRKWELRPAFKKLKDDVNFIEEEKKRLLTEYGNEKGQIPAGVQQEVNKEFYKVLNTDVDNEFNKYPKFTLEEIERADSSKEILSSEIALLDDRFIVQQKEE